MDSPTNSSHTSETHQDDPQEESSGASHQQPASEPQDIQE